MVGPTNVQPLLFKAFDNASDSTVEAGMGVSEPLVSENVIFSFGSNDQKNAAKEPNSFCNSLALFELLMTRSGNL